MNQKKTGPIVTSLYSLSCFSFLKQSTNSDILFHRKAFIHSSLYSKDLLLKESFFSKTIFQWTLKGGGSAFRHFSIENRCFVACLFSLSWNRERKDLFNKKHKCLQWARVVIFHQYFVVKFWSPFSHKVKAIVARQKKFYQYLSLFS